MFYSESLLSKTGPLARVWLASNLDRKLTKQNVLASKLEDNVKDIIGVDQAPMALRLSSQLLLGVCKIYNRKATYLMDDCSEALLKIKMAFRPGNVDLPSNQSHKANPNALLLPDTITELDLFAPLPDPDDFLAGNDSRAPGQDPTLLDFGMSQILDSQTPTKRTEKRLLQLHDDDLGLDMGLDDDLLHSSRMSEGPSIEIGRRAQSVRPDQPSLLEDDLGLDLDLGDDDTMGPDTTLRPSSAGGLLADDDVAMGGMDDEIAAANAAALARADAAKRLPRDSESPLSSARSSVAPVFEGDSFRPDTTLAMEDEEDPTLVQAAQRAKRRKVMTMDTETELQVHELRQQQEDRSAITKAPTYLPRDPLLLQLLEMQRSGTFVSNILGDGYLAGMAPELRGILSLEIIRKAGNKKRKRDSGVADVGSDAEEEVELDDAPQLDIPADDDFDGAPTPAPHFSDGFGHDDEMLAAGGEDSYTAHFDITEAPLLHPSQSGPVALGTKKMVHLLRDRFGSSSSNNTAASPSTRTGTVALFTDLCPERTTGAAAATAAFFELLVLGTKDAIKVEQDNRKVLGGPLRVRAKRGLWGDWAEMTGAAAASNSEEATARTQARVQESIEEQRDFAPAASAMVEVGA